MVLIQKKCERILSELEEEVLGDLERVRGPNKDEVLERILEFEASNYAKKLYEELEPELGGRVIFTKYAESSREESLISALFLNLYRLDAPALRRDLYILPQRVPTPRRDLNILLLRDPVQATAAQRKDLLWLLYHTVSLYTGGDLSPLAAAYNRSIRRQTGSGPADRYKPVLSAFAKRVCSCEGCGHRDFDYSPYIQELILTVSADGWSGDFEHTREGKVLVTLLRNLYGQNASDLQNELKAVETASVKTRVLNAEKRVDSDREELLLILYQALFSYIEQDLSWLIAACDRVEAAS